MTSSFGRPVGDLPQNSSICPRRAVGLCARSRGEPRTRIARLTPRGPDRLICRDHANHVSPFNAPSIDPFGLRIGRSSACLVAPHASRADPVVAEAKPFGHVERKDPRLDRLIPPDAQVERLVNGITWCEGPVWVSDGGYLLFSEIPRNSIYRWKSARA